MLMSGALSRTATMGDMKNPAPPGMPGDSSPKIITGGIITMSSIIESGILSSLHTTIATISIDIVEQLLLRTVPNTMETSAMSWFKPRSCSAEIMFTARVSYEPPVPKPVGHTDPKYDVSCFHVRLVRNLQRRNIARDQMHIIIMSHSTALPY